MLYVNDLDFIDAVPDNLGNKKEDSADDTESARIKRKEAENQALAEGIYNYIYPISKERIKRKEAENQALAERYSFFSISIILHIYKK